jgi:hypothetical protein
MTEGSSTGSQSREALAVAAAAAGDPLPVCSSEAHPVSSGIIVRSRVTTMAVKRSGMEVVFVTLARPKNCCMIKVTKGCSIQVKTIGCGDLCSRWFVRDTG